MDARHLGFSGGSPTTTAIATADGIRHAAWYDGLTTNGNDAAIARDGPQRHVSVTTNDAVVVDDAAIDDDVAAADASYAVANHELGLQSTNATASV